MNPIPVAPDFTALGSDEKLARIIGALMTVALLVAVIVLIASAITWAIASNAGSWHLAQRARAGVLVALGGAVLAGGAIAWMSWLLGVGLSFFLPGTGIGVGSTISA
ncbi:DUF6112 family protein [Xylanimonas protaetiae]|uniref:DUF6112 family protein n=1 Tax=Xylanimonas protaetiae TaxID=2509457 RepID=UPI00315A4A2D